MLSGDLNNDDTFKTPTGIVTGTGADLDVFAAELRDGALVLDFNLAYNPPCVFSPYATCPLPPPENRTTPWASMTGSIWRPLNRAPGNASGSG